MSKPTRRDFFSTAGAATAGFTVPAGSRLGAASDGDDAFLRTPPQRALEIVSVSHFDGDRVREILTEDRSLCLASWDWGFGDWESALGAASHMARRDIARVLIDHGARPNLFTLAMLDKVEAVRAACQASPGIQRIRGPHGITLLRHAEFGKAERVVEYLQQLGGADEGVRFGVLDDRAVGLTVHGGRPILSATRVSD